MNILTELLISLKSFHEAFQVWGKSRNLIGHYGRQVVLQSSVICFLFEQVLSDEFQLFAGNSSGIISQVKGPQRIVLSVDSHHIVNW